jgi:DNA (cytosine-5)-methyltransferase 1
MELSLRTVSLFSGCGGSDLGASRAGAEIIFANDNNKNAIATYLKYKQILAVPDATVLNSDISDISNFPQCDLLLGCYPCQSFTMGGNRTPDSDPRSTLYLQFCRALYISKAKFFITENVTGLAWLKSGRYLKEQLTSLENTGRGYNISIEMLNSKDYGVPQDRKRLFIVGVRKDLSLYYHFPPPTHGQETGKLPFVSHGDVTLQLKDDPIGEYYNYEKEPFSWWYLSRNRKRPWSESSYTIQANWRHNPIHPASPTMRLVESNLKDGYKQRWEFTNSYDHLDDGRDLPVFEQPRRLSWRESAVIQTFPTDFEPIGNVSSKQEQIGNATPPLLMEVIVKQITNEKGIKKQRQVPKSYSLTSSLSRLGLLS